MGCDIRYMVHALYQTDDRIFEENAPAAKPRGTYQETALGLGILSSTEKVTDKATWAGFPHVIHTFVLTYCWFNNL